MIRLIAFDLDGTLFDANKKITELTKRLLAQAMEHGIEIVPATGRPFCGLSKEITSLDGIHYVLTTNGAGIYETKHNQCIYENNMKLERFLPLMARLEPLDIMADAFVKGECYMSQKNRGLIEEMDASEEMKAYIRNSRTTVENLTEYLRKRGDDVQKITINFVSHPDGTLRDYEKTVAIVREYPEFIYVSGGLNNIEVTEQSASKGTGLLALGRQLGISKEEMMAFGDSGNDLAMIQMAGVGVAMGNAEPEVKIAADFVTRRNTEEGIAYALRQLIPEINWME